MPILDTNYNPAIGAVGGRYDIAKLDSTGATSGQVPVYNGTTVAWDTVGGTSDVLTTKVSLSSAEILNLETTPKTLVAAPGTGKIVQILNYIIKYNYGTVAYVPNGVLQVFYDTAADVVSEETVLTLTNSISKYINILTAATTSQILEDKAVILMNSGTPTDGDGTLDIYITYKIVTL